MTEFIEKLKQLCRKHQVTLTSYDGICLEKHRWKEEDELRFFSSGLEEELGFPLPIPPPLTEKEIREREKLESLRKRAVEKWKKEQEKREKERLKDKEYQLILNYVNIDPAEKKIKLKSNFPRGKKININKLYSFIMDSFDSLKFLEEESPLTTKSEIHTIKEINGWKISKDLKEKCENTERLRF